MTTLNSFSTQVLIKRPSWDAGALAACGIPDHGAGGDDRLLRNRDWGDRFAKERITLFFGPGRHGPGNNLFFMVVDADRNRLEFSAEVEITEASRPPGVWPQEEYTLNPWGRAWIRS